LERNELSPFVVIHQRTCVPPDGSADASDILFGWVAYRIEVTTASVGGVESTALAKARHETLSRRVCRPIRIGFPITTHPAAMGPVRPVQQRLVGLILHFTRVGRPTTRDAI